MTGAYLTTRSRKDNRMKLEERAAQMWSVLALAARTRQVLTYSIMSQLTGMATAGVGGALEPVQSYCLLKNLPPLTVLVVSEATGNPGSGFSGASDVQEAQARVFAHDWFEHRAPSPEDLAAAVRERPSKGKLLDSRTGS